MSQRPIYHLEKIQHGYGRRRVLDVSSLSMMRGEILAIVGPSGAGKSTLLRLLNFLELPDEGRLEFDGVPVSANLPLAVRRRVTTVFQHPVLLQRSLLANLLYGATLRGMHLTAAQLSEWLERLGLAHLKHQSARKLSGGEAQRVALARALIIRPDVLLLDEPTANLDPANVGLIEEIVRAENQDRGTTIVLVTHNIFQARRMADRTLLLLDGREVECAPTRQFFESPAEQLTSAFLRGEYIY